ncbi:MAG: MFS transporter [Deltaproteobacteria bacterium]|nr:MFS transporter [Deltaproteobacteria bacterium]MBW1931541.1 MFS transporter [Deltaproteobacteria bacterium]MBW1938043.1 MFS transporter [Deltaproteobacteria bacterium]MBW1963639.1 MFS transporter [Deltaproteobacteria bacterium]MBW2080565.1 MFS transporter [Deltaproteobacteria bacterium]
MGEKVISKKSIIAGGIGNVLEWYDFAVYGYFATIISSQFFPKEDKIVGLIATFGIFAAGFLVRPLGGLIFGSIGDKYGRKKALTASVFMMAIPTTLIGLIPTYDMVGIWAAVILTVLRLFQGISVGGELTGSISFIAETAPQNRRGFYVSTTLFGAVSGILLGSLVGTVLASVMPSDILNNWGWRLPFLAGIIIGFAGLILRRHMREAENFKKLKESGSTAESPVKEFWKDHKANALVTVFGLWCFSVSFYMIFLYLASYTHIFLNYDLKDALSINTISMIFLLILIPVMGRLSDRYGRKKILISGQIGFVVFSIPLFLLIDMAEHWHILLAQLGFAVLVATQQGVIPAALVERFPTRIRYTGLSISYNIGLALFGGTTPMLCTWLIHEFGGNVLLPGYYLMLASIISLVAVSRFKETYKKELD